MTDERVRIEKRVSPEEAAGVLEGIADQLRLDGDVTFESDTDVITLETPEYLPLSFQAQQVKGGISTGDVQQIRFHLEWERPKEQTE